MADLRRDLLHRVRDATGATATNNIADRYLNTALHDMHLDPGHNWPWAIRRAYILTHAPYTTGTVSITAAARTTVTGSSTLWNTAVTGMGFNNARAGGKMTFSGSLEVYEVSTVDSDTQITLTNRWSGDALSAASYAYYEDEYALVSDFLRPVDTRNFSLSNQIHLIGDREFYRRHPRNSTRSKPREATIIQLAFSGATTPRLRVVFSPAPDDEYEIPYRYITSNLAVDSTGAEKTQLTATTDEPIVPLYCRHAIVFHALYHWYRDRKDDKRSQEAKAEYVDIMGRIAGTVLHGASDRPRFAPNYGRYLGRRYGGGRYEGDDKWFDELRDRNY